MDQQIKKVLAGLVRAGGPSLNEMTLQQTRTFYDQWGNNSMRSPGAVEDAMQNTTLWSTRRGER